MTARLRVPPTRSVLLWLRRRRQALLSAADLLERKCRVLAQKAYELLPRWQQLHQQGYTQLETAYRSFTVTRMRSTAGELRQIVAGMPALISLQLRRQPLSGVPTFQVTTERVPLRPRFGLLGSTAELDRTIGLLRDAVHALAALAAVQATLRALARALLKTNRQVRILRDHLIPIYENTIHYIEDTLDEQERDYLFQLRRLR
ncbi:MAG: V-type ATP synthase subunit D [Planctomycetes bacterium]|nr:V-type ATP synthase subunit D [Planctomycetota bacterium]